MRSEGLVRKVKCSHGCHYFCYFANDWRIWELGHLCFTLLSDLTCILRIFPVFFLPRKRPRIIGRIRPIFASIIVYILRKVWTVALLRLEYIEARTETKDVCIWHYLVAIGLL